MSDDTVISAGENPEAATRMAQEVMQGTDTNAPPEPPEPMPDIVTLPGGIYHPQYGVMQKAEIRELTGKDEEYLYKGKNNHEFKKRVLERGLVKIEDVEPDAEMLGLLLIGDREFLIKEIRKATYGQDVELSLTCNNCRESQDIAIDLDEEVPDTEVDPTEQVVVEGRKHAYTIVRPCSADEDELVSEMNKNIKNTAELNTFFISKVLVNIDSRPVLGQDDARNLNMGDRTKILDKLAEIQPGPDYTQVEHSCVGCGRTFPVVLDVNQLFR